MITIKPLEATPVLEGEDARKVIEEVLREPRPGLKERKAFAYEILRMVRR